MTTLLDLPAEILTKLPFGRTLLLHTARLHDEQWRDDRVTLAALARTCRTLHTVFNPVLYTSLNLTSLPVANRLRLLRTISSQPSLAKYVEDCKLDLFTHRFPLRDSQTSQNDGVTLERLSVSDGDWYRLLGYLFFPNTNNIKQLAIRCTHFESIPCDFGKLVNAHIQSYCQGKGIGMDCSGVRQLLLAPRIENLILSGPYINGAQELEKLPSSVSNVSGLALRIVMLSPETLSIVLRLPRNLTSFEFYSAYMRAPFLEATSRDRFITFQQVSNALQYQKDNLDTVKICYPSSDAELPPSIFGGLSLDNFSRLTKLSIAPEMFLGWKECKHQNYNTDRLVGPSEPITFANCLPHCLEELTIFVQQYQRARNGNGYALGVVRGVLNQRKRLYKLGSVELACCKGVIFCSQCRVAALTYLDRAATVQRDEVARISQMCEEVGIRFTWNEGIWEEP